jgi:hypothetical protein
MVKYLSLSKVNAKFNIIEKAFIFNKITKMKKNIFVVALLMCFGFGFSSCKDGGNPPEPPPMENNPIVGTWELVKITGGYHGQGAKVESPEVLNIFNQNKDLSFNYEWWISDTLFQSDKIIFKDKLSIYGEEYQVISMGNGYNLYSFRFYEEDNKLIMELAMEAYDGYLLSFQKNK